MTRQPIDEIRQEAELIRRFAETYHRRLARLIEQMNQGPAPDECLRLCVEAVDVVLTSQDRLAQSLSKLADERGPAAVRPAA